MGARPVARYHCAGNAPDFDFAGGTLACISRGAPGTTFGAKLQTFCEAPHGGTTTAEATLSEVVIFSPSFEQARGVRLACNSLHALLDEQRLLRCSVP